MEKAKDIEVYKNMYAYVQSNIKDKERVLPFSPTTLYISSLSDNRTLYYKDIEDLDIIEFVRALYLNLLLRFPEEGIIENLPKSFSSKKEELVFKNKYLEKVLLSPEAQMSGAKVIGYSISFDNKFKIIKTKLRNHLINFIYKMWVKLPEGIRKSLRKIMRK